MHTASTYNLSLSLSHSLSILSLRPYVSDVQGYRASRISRLIVSICRSPPPGRFIPHWGETLLFAAIATATTIAATAVAIAATSGVKRSSNVYYVPFHIDALTKLLLSSNRYLVYVIYMYYCTYTKHLMNKGDSIVIIRHHG